MIIRNALRTPDGTVICSRSRHDYVTHTDANGKTYMVDGGFDYVRCSAHDDQEMLMVTLDQPHEQVREALEWGTRGPLGTEPLRLVKLCDMSTDHIQACLDNVPNMLEQFRIAMQQELTWRNKPISNTGESS